ncbi:PTS sugar transporter subunit IIA [Streptococcus sp. ZJ151]
MFKEVYLLKNILFTDATSQEELFDVVADYMESIAYVTKDYKQSVKSREEEFPTGLKIDLKDGTDTLFAAIPHTEPQYCLVETVVYVKNENPILFKHMINPSEECFVQDFFFIINNNKESQTDILSNLITFFITKGNLDYLHKCDRDKESIANYLTEKGVFQND